MFIGIDFLLGALGVQVAVGVVEQAQFVLRLKNAAASLVDVGHGHLALVERFLECAQEAVGYHIHVGTGLECQGRNLLQIAHAVVDHLADSGVVGHDKTVKAPAVAQHLGHEPAVARGGDVVDDVERGHVAACTGIYTGLVGREILVEHAHVAHIHRVVVTAGFGSAVEGEVLDTCHHSGFVGQIGALVALNHRAADGRAQERVFAVTFAHASPAGLAADVHHGAESPADAVGRGLNRGDAGRVANGVHVPAHRHGKWNREHRLIAVDHVHTENQGNAQSALLDSDFLQRADALHALHVEQAAHLAGLDLADDVAAHGRTRDDVARNRQIELPDFLLQGHFAHQVVDKLVHLGLVNGLNAQGANHHSQCE